MGAHHKQVIWKWAQNMTARLHFKYLIAKYFPLSQFACPSQIPNGRLNLYRVFMGESKTKAYVRRGILNAD